jgi:ureidoglycolate lyase
VNRKLNAEMIIRPEPLSREAFMPFGDVIEISGHHAELINSGNTQKFPDQASFVAAEQGSLGLSIYRSQPCEMPFTLKTLECHPLGSQAFYPLHSRPFPVVVALAVADSGVMNIRAFMTNGMQGVNLNPGIWHHYQLSLGQESDYLVIDRAGNGNFEEFVLPEPLLLKI